MTARDFFHDSTGTVRAPWRLLVFAVVTVASLAVINGAAVPLLSWVLAATRTRVVLYPWVLLASIVVAHAIVFRWFEPRRWLAVGMDGAAAEPAPLVTAALLGGLAIGLPSLALLGIGWLQALPGPAGSSLIAAGSIALFLAPAALWEEMLFRGYAFTVLREWWGTPAALGASSLVFGAVHFQNEGASVSSVLVVVLAGMFLGGVVIVTRSLWAAFAAHLAWNWVLAAVLHSAVSGIPFTTPDYRVVDAGPDWATGGVWGPEGGIPAALGLVVASISLYLRRRRREES
ncbi:MAG TPA: type II CAAX endopeptidase family protein [Gemmatimonadaceae bacterium]|nr:type II CAAX endopeptidase family protein [Gemmatimonadaceae bacterium]